VRGSESIRTDRESFDKLFAERPPARILVESSTESEWCARHLEALGHEVVVADPNFAAANRHHTHKTPGRRRVRGHRPSH
jgi:transposase